MGAFSGCGADQLKVLFIQKFQPVVTAMATALARYGFIPKKRTWPKGIDSSVGQNVRSRIEEAAAAPR